MALAIDFRGYGKSKSGNKGSKARYEDILAAIRFLRKKGARRVSVLGGSMGGGAAALASIQCEEGEIDCLVLLSPVPVRAPGLIKGDKLFIASEEERLRPRIEDQYEKAQEPEKLVTLKGKAHAQHIFETEQSGILTKIILDSLEGKTKN